MRRIKPLADAVINKIAAGEVVERPASIIKELVENAIDAGAKRIGIELADGGKKSIVVSDDGHGILRDDLPFAIMRHATSKIVHEDDLFNVLSLGFRGEALASIAAVSNLSIRTQPQSEKGSELQVKGGETLPVRDWQGVRGTSVAVEDLFFNVPARKAFLKASAAEYSACLELVQSLVLGHPHVAFSFQHNGKNQIECQAIPAERSWEDAMRQRVSELFSKDLSDTLIYTEQQNRFAKVKALVSPPGKSFAHARNMFFFLNGRAIKDKTVRFGVIRGYHSHLLKGKYPAVVVAIESDPSLIDVNVHPAKTEVRFQYGSDVQSALAIAVREAMRSGTWTSPELATGDAHAALFGQTPDFVPSAAIPSRRFEELSLGRSSMPVERSSYTPRSASSYSIPSTPSYQGSYAPEPEEPKKESIPWHELTYIGSFARCYLMFEHQSRLLVIDQHAFHERVLYERLTKKTSDLCVAQPLMIPESLEFMPGDLELLAQRETQMRDLGFSYTKLDDTHIELNSVPELLRRKDPLSALQAVVEALKEHESEEAASEALYHDLFSTMACHAAVRSGESLPENELSMLMNEASTVDFYHNCPHGRPVFKWWPLSQVAGWFDR